MQVDTPKLGKTERKELIRKVSKASGIAQYALEKKMTDEQLVELQENLDVIQSLKKANDYNRYVQGQRTRAANDKLKQFMSPENSEIVAAGKWLLNAFNKKGQERKETLLEKDLVHKTDYNGAVGDMADSLEEVQDLSEKMSNEAEIKIMELQSRIDTLRKQLVSIQSFVTNNYGQSVWREIENRF